jgi:Tfp pilus assembly PilM family ATPase
MLGIYIEPGAITIVQSRPVSGKTEIEHLVKIPTSFSFKEGIMRPLSLNNEFFSEKAAWVAAFKQAVKKTSWATTRATVTFSQHFGILRYFVMPFVDRKYWGKSIPIESKKYIPVAFEEVIYDFTATPLEEGKKLGVIFGLTQRKTVEFLINVFTEAGLQLTSLEMSACSMERLFAYLDPKEHDDKAYVHFSGETSCMLLSSSGFPVLYRETDFSSTSSSSLSERKRLDVKSAFQFVSRYAGGKEYKKLLLSGDSAEAWQGMASAESPVPVEIWAPLVPAGLKTAEQSQLFALGASLSGPVPGKVRLDMTGLSAGSAVEQKVTRYVWTVTSVIASFFLLLAAINHARIYVLNSEIAGIMSQVGDVTEFQNHTEESIRDVIEKGSAETRMLRSLFSDKEVLAPKIQALGDAIPGDLWAQSISYRYNLPLNDNAGTEKQLSLLGSTRLQGQLKFNSVDLYVRNLKTLPELKLFQPPTGTIQFNLASSGKAGFSAAEGPDEDATPFTVILTAK